MTTEELIFDFLGKFSQIEITYPAPNGAMWWSGANGNNSSTVLTFQGNYIKELLLLKNKILQNKIDRMQKKEDELTKGGGVTENTTPFSIVRPLQDCIPCQVQTFAKENEIFLQKKEEDAKKVAPAFTEIGDTYTFFDDGKSIEQMIKENPELLGKLEWVLNLPGVQKGKEASCLRTIALAQEKSETTSKTFTQQEEWAETHNRSICTLRQIFALYLSAKKAGKTPSSCWMRAVDQGKSGVRFIVEFGADGVHVLNGWYGNADSCIGLATSPISPCQVQTLANNGKTE